MQARRLRRSERKLHIRDEVIAAAVTLFPSRGYHGASVELIAEQAGFSTGAVYSNFAGKADLFLAAYERRMSSWAREIAEALASATPGEQATGAGSFWREFVTRDRDWILLELEFLAVAARDDELTARFAALWRQPRHLTEKALRASEEAGAVRLPISASELALAVNALGVGLLLERILQPAAVPDQLFQSWLGLLAQALSP